MSEFQGTWLQEAVKNVIISLSAFGFGCALYLTFDNIRRAVRSRGHKRRLWIARALVTSGFVMIVGLLTEAIYRANQPLSLTWRVLLYTGAIAVTAFGYVGVVYETYRSDKEDENRGRFL